MEYNLPLNGPIDLDALDGYLMSDHAPADSMGLSDLDGMALTIEAGTLGTKPPNAADYQIATSVRLLLCFDDLRETLEPRPAAIHAHRIVPDFPGRIPPVIQAEWLPTARSPA